MLSILTVVLPTFALIFTGWIARKGGALGPHASSELNRFVVYLALPALLFDIVANAEWHQLWQPGFLATFGLGALLIFGLTLILSLRRAKPLADAALDGLNASYANTGFMGFPLVLAIIGPSALAPTLIATLLTVCVLFAIALVLVELGIQREQPASQHILRNLLRSLARNPLLIAPTLGGLVLLLGIELPGFIKTFLTLLGAAAPPCALIALGLFLAEQSSATGSRISTTIHLVGFKLLAHPLITWLLATQVFNLSAELTLIAVLLAALPTGTGPFMVASFYRREAATTSRAILVSVILSLVTITIYLAVANPVS